MQKVKEGNLAFPELILFLYFSLHGQKQSAEVSTIWCVVLPSETLQKRHKSTQIKKKQPKEINGMKGCE